MNRIPGVQALDALDRRLVVATQKVCRWCRVPTTSSQRNWA